MHDWIAVLAADPPSTSDSTNLKVAIIAAVALILAAAIPALLSTREREPRALRDARTDMKTQRDRLQKRSDWQDDYIEALEAALWEKQIDPRNLKPPGEPSQ